MKKYNFWGFEHADVHAVNDEYKGIDTPYDLYDALSEIWCAKTCAPRMRQNWTKENKTLGQCSITAFLAQDIFGVRQQGDATAAAGNEISCVNIINALRMNRCDVIFSEKRFFGIIQPLTWRRQNISERRITETADVDFNRMLE